MSLRATVPPVEVSRLMLLGLVAAAAVVSIATSGAVSNFAGGFAAGAGSVFVVSYVKNPRHPPPAEDERATAP